MNRKGIFIFSMVGLSFSALSSEITQKQLKLLDYKGAMHEQCLNMKQGDHLYLNFTSQKPVDFDIHWHPKNSGTGTEYLFQKSESLNLTKTIQIPENETYCVTFQYQGNDDTRTMFNIDFAYQVN